MYRYIKDILKFLMRYALKDMDVFSPSPLYPTVFFLHLCKKLLPAVKIILLVEEKQSMHRLKNLKEKTVF